MLVRLRLPVLLVVSVSSYSQVFLHLFQLLLTSLPAFAAVLLCENQQAGLTGQQRTLHLR